MRLLFLLLLMACSNNEVNKPNCELYFQTTIGGRKFQEFKCVKPDPSMSCFYIDTKYRCIK